MEIFSFVNLELYVRKIHDLIKSIYQILLVKVDDCLQLHMLRQYTRFSSGIIFFHKIIYFAHKFIGINAINICYLSTSVDALVLAFSNSSLGIISLAIGVTGVCGTYR